jgi:hypothetical protein
MIKRFFSASFDSESGSKHAAEKLELKTINKVATLMEIERWDIFMELDDCFESVASTDRKRLEQSKNISI